MNQIRILTVLCAGILLWTTACTTDHEKSAPSSNAISDAIHAVDNNPKEALSLLESIADPVLLSDYNKDQYMQYIVILTQARYMDYQDITGDSLILDAQRYFAKTQNFEMAARASFYAAIYWHEGEVGDKAVEYWQAAFSFAERAGNNLFTAKSAYWLGISYYNQEQWDDAMIYYQKALTFYDNKPDAGHYKLDITEILGQIYWKQEKLEQAYQYFDDGLKAAKKLNNAKYEARFLRNKGIIHRDKGEYGQAKEYFDLAFSIQPDAEDKLRIYLSYTIFYRDINRPDSTLYYLSLIEERIPEITYPNTRRDMYLELTTYYKSNKGDGEKIAHYSQLAHTEDLRIKKSQNEKKIEAINQQLEQLRQKKQTEWRTYRRIFDYGLIALILLASLLAIIGVKRHELKGKYKQIKRKYEDVRNLLFTQTVDHQHFLLAGLRSVARSTDVLYQKANAESPVLEQQLTLLKEFSAQLALYAKTKLEKLNNGEAALLKLTPEDLSIMQLSRMRFPDEEIGWLLGHKVDTKEQVIVRKEQILQILIEVEMSEKDIKIFLP